MHGKSCRAARLLFAVCAVWHTCTTLQLWALGMQCPLLPAGNRDTHDTGVAFIRAACINDFVLHSLCHDLMQHHCSLLVLSPKFTQCY